MMAITHNEPRDKDFTTLQIRGAVEHRATWMALLLEEAKAENADFEKIGRTAIRKCGQLHSKIYAAQCADPTNVADFADAFFHEQGSKNMQIDVLEKDHDHTIAEFRQCPLVQAWEKLGYAGKDLELLCDIAMDGDRGIADGMGLKLDITKTIAAGDGLCRLHFHR